MLKEIAVRDQRIGEIEPSTRKANLHGIMDLGSDHEHCGLSVKRGGAKLAKVRFADPKDAVCLAEMNSVFNHRLIDARVIREKIRRGNEIILIAEIGNHIAGFACAQVFDSFCYATPYAELTELFVKAAQRREGAAVALVRQMERELGSHGVTHIHILTGARNRPARALYERLGYLHNREKPEVLYDKNMRRKKHLDGR